MTTALYARISADPTGTGLGVERQLEDCRRMAGGPAVEYTDNDISAYNGSPRPGYEAMLAAIESGEVHEVIAWHPDRLHRQPKELERFIDLLDVHDVKVRTVTAGQYDLSTPSGRMTARILGAVARQESEHKAERVRRALEQRREKGERHGRIPFGWREDGEADVVRRIVTGILAGDSLNGLAVTLNHEGIAAPGGKTWSGVQVRQVARRWANAGMRAEGITGQWPALVTMEQQETVRRVLDQPGRQGQKMVRKHLLTGVLHCYKCGHTLFYKHTSRGVGSYVCPDRHVSTRADLTEQFVLTLVQARLAAPDALEATAATDDTHKALEARLVALRGRLDGLAQDYADGVLDREQVRVAGDRLRGEVAEVEARLADHERRHAVLAHAGIDLLALNPDRQRAVIQSVVRVTVQPGKGGQWTPDRIGVEWVS